MKCSKCNSQVSDAAKFCDNCGNSLMAPNSENTTSQGKKKKGKGCLIPIFIVFLFLIFIIGIFSNSSNNTNDTNKASTSTSSTKEKTKEELAQELEQFKAECEAIDYKELARNPQNYIAKKLVYSGRVIQVMESGNDAAYRIDITKGDYGYDDTVYVTYKKSQGESRILEDDIVMFWGVSEGLETYETVLKAEVSIPKIQAKAIQLIEN